MTNTPAASQPTAELDPNAAWPEVRTETERAYELILNALLSGALAPTEEDPASEISVAETFGFGSRMPVRMALSLLASEGLIAQRARRGFWRVCPEPQEIQQISAMRADAEAMIFSAFSARLHDGEVGVATPLYQSIVEAQREMELRAEQAQGSPAESGAARIEAEFADADTRFHTTIAAAAGYTLPAQNIAQWRNFVRAYRACNHVHYAVTDLWSMYREHEGLLARAHQAAEECTDEGDERLEAAAQWHVARSVARAGIAMEPAALKGIVGSLADPFIEVAVENMPMAQRHVAALTV
jgi:DNA-binding GntR family transcriptional regulator